LDPRPNHLSSAPQKRLFHIKEHRDEQDASFGGRVDAFISFSYQDECMLLTGQAMELGINFKVFVLSVGPAFTSYRNAFGARTVEGIIGGGAWNAKSSPGAKKICRALQGSHRRRDVQLLEFHLFLLRYAAF